MENCRVCGAELDKDTLVVYIDNMPSSVQNLPSCSRDAFISITDLDIRQCALCGVVQLTNDPVPYYKDVIRNVSSSLKDRQKVAFQRFIDYFGLQNKKVIEIGSGKGEYIDILNICDVKATAMEGYPTKLLEKFDAFVCINFLEHIPNPIDFLTKISDLLVDGGKGMISVPDFESELKDNALFTFMSDHLLYFSKETLYNVLSINGYQIDEIFRNDDLNVITAYVNKRQKLDVQSSISRFHELSKDVDRFINTTGKIAVWGASHLAFSILASLTMNNIDKIDYIVDSSPRKQGKFSPVTCLPIHSPEYLLKRPVDAVLVIAPEYSDEIVDIAKKAYDIKNIATFVDGELNEVCSINRTS